MLIETEGIVLRQIKISYNRKMIVLFSKKNGKISAGTNIGERAKSKSTLALRPFTYGKYELFKNRESYNINSTEVVRSYYAIGEDIDKYLNGSYVLEFTENVLEEGLPMPGVFNLLIDFFDQLENREKGIKTLVLAYQIKLFKKIGVMPELNSCINCGKPNEPYKFSIKDGGYLCEDCFNKNQNLDTDTLIFNLKFDIVDIMKFLANNPFNKLQSVALTEDAGKDLQKIIREYAKYHLNMPKLKSEEMI